MINIEFKIDADRYLDNITWDLQIAMEAESLTHAQCKQLCVVFLVDDKGEFYPEEEANRILGGMTLRQVEIAADKLMEGITRLGKAQVPLAPAKPSSTPSTTAEPSP